MNKFPTWMDPMLATLYKDGPFDDPDWINSFEVQHKEKGKQMMLEVHTKPALEYSLLN
jgi:hypothetical protein